MAPAYTNGSANAAPSQPAPERRSTISIAVAASCVENAQNQQLATLLASQIARAAAIFNIDEVIVLDDVPRQQTGVPSAAATLMARVVQYLETPQYLRKALCPMLPELKFAGLMPPLDAAHHLRTHEWSTYREGVVRSSSPESGSIIDIGLEQDARIPEQIEPNTRVTLFVGVQPQMSEFKGHAVYSATLASPVEPRQKEGRVWGYVTRIAPTLQAMLQESPFEGGYDLVIGTSERGEQTPSHELAFRPYKHALIVTGGPQGLEAALQQDPWSKKYADVSQIFDRYLNTCFHQGSRTIRTEEALFISLTFLNDSLQRSCMD